MMSMNKSLLSVIHRLQEILLVLDVANAEMRPEDALLVRQAIAKLIRDLQHELGYQPVQFED